MSRLVSDHGSDTEEDKPEDPRLAQEKNQRSERATHKSTSIDSDLPGVLRESSVELSPKVLCALKKLESSFINPEATKLVEEFSCAKASDEAD